MGKFIACRALLGTILPRFLKVPLYEFVSNIFSIYEYFSPKNIHEGGEATAEEEVLASGFV
jgi:hypothetical protein